MPYHYTTGAPRHWPHVTTFEFYRFRFHFRAVDQVHFPHGKSANVVRGAFGTCCAMPCPAVYARLFEPGSALGPRAQRPGRLAAALCTPRGPSRWPDDSAGRRFFSTRTFSICSCPRWPTSAPPSRSGEGPRSRTRPAKLERTEQLDLGRRCAASRGARRPPSS